MCFSPAASFLTAAVTGAAGLLSLSMVRRPQDLPLAATPLLFAVQQALEGFIWLRLPAAPNGCLSGALPLGYLVFAQAFWPAYAPIAAWLAEPEPRRRRWMTPWILVGVLVAAYLLQDLLVSTPGARLAGGHIIYAVELAHFTVVGFAYLAAISLPLLLSSHRSLVALGVVVMVGCVVAYFAYLEAFQSVWCYFAAAASVLILGHFALARRARPKAVLA